MTTVPVAPEFGDSAAIEGPTVKVAPLLLVPPDTTVTGPVETPAGAATTIAVLLQEDGTAGIPLKRTWLVP